jgi:hypothetical protein
MVSSGVNSPLIVAASKAASNAATSKYTFGLENDSKIFGISVLNLRITETFIFFLAVPIILSYAKKFIVDGPYAYRGAWVGAFLLNLITVSIPGRFDNLVVAGGGKLSFPWRTVFAPAGWAFAIWGLIYSGEALLVAYVGAIGTPKIALKNAAIYWLAGSIYQAKWTFLFREQFINNLYLPMISLALGSASLFAAHGALTNAIYPSMDVWEKIQLIAIRSPISLHATWLTAASLLNLNAWTSKSGASLGSQVAVGFATAYFASIVGIVISIMRGDPLVALVVAWALRAVSSQTLIDCQVKELPQSTVEALALTEKVLSNILLGTAIATPVLSHGLKMF